MLDILFKKKYRIVLGKNWNPIATIYLSQTPRSGEYIYINDELGYLNVLNVVHRPKTLSPTTFIVVEKTNNKENLRG
jgi:hypothetical protein